jgi:hypothetical protein
MPTHNESVPNRALSAVELKQILLDDFMRLLENEGMLAGTGMSFPRVGYTIGLALHLDNHLNSESHVSDSSKPLAHNVPDDTPGKGVLFTPPLAPADDGVPAEVAATRLDRMIQSPNAERLRIGLPVPMEIRDHDGTVRQESAIYPPDDTIGDGDVTITDTTAETRAKWGQLDDVIP